MNKTVPLPRYDDNLATFLGDLRAIVFSSQSKAADHLDCSHTTISRYENGIMKPLPGYLAYLAYLIDKNMQTDETGHREILLNELNQAIQWNYDSRSTFHDWDKLRIHALDYKKPEEAKTEKTAIRVDWGEAPDTSIFYGRQRELRELQALVRNNQARMLVIVGMAGIGKTSIATRLAQNIQKDFDFVLWRSLRNAPQLDQMLHDILARFVTDFDASYQHTLDQQIRKLLEFMRQNRCLIVLDNLESILSTGSKIGHYRAGYEGYDSFLKLIANTQHQSCVILTSRETPSGLEHITSEHKEVHIQSLEGVDVSASIQLLLAQEGMAGQDEDFEKLTELYSGNMLALKLVKNTILKIFDGDVAKFLQQEGAIFTDIRQLLDTTHGRLSPLACELLYWMAVERKPVTFASLNARLMPQRRHNDILDALQSLERASLIDYGESGFLLQNVISEYLIDRLISEVYKELEDETFKLLQRLALLTTDASETIRNTQQHLIIKPIADRLKLNISAARLRPKFERLLVAIREQDCGTVGFAAGNLLNIMLYTGRKIHNYDFSALAIQHAYLENATLTDVDFTGAEFSNCLFNNTFVGINTVALSPKAYYLAIATSTEVRIWGLWDRQLHHILRGHSDLIWDVVFLDDEQYLVSRDSHTVHVWNFITGEIEHTISFEHTIRSLAVDSTRTLLAIGDTDGSISIHYALTTDFCTKLDTNINANIYTITFSDDGKYIAAGDSDGVIWVWSLNSMEVVCKFTDHHNRINVLTFMANDDLLISGDTDGHIGLWDMQTGGLERMIPAHNAMISGLKATGHRFISSSYDKTIKIWDLEQLDPVLTLHRHDLPINAIDIDESGRTLVGGGYDRRVHLWNTRDGYLIDTITGLTFEVHALAFNPDSRLLAGGSTDYRLYNWDWSANTRIQVHAGHSRWISSVAFHPNGQHIASGSYDRTIRIWHVNTSKEIAVLTEPEYWIYCLNYSANGRWLAAAGVDRVLRIWETNPYTIKHTLGGHEDVINCLAFHPERDWLMTGGKDRSVRLWDAVTGECLSTLTGLASEVTHLGFQDNDIGICILANGQVIRWDVITNIFIDKQQLPPTIPQITTISPNGVLLAHYETHVVKIYDLNQHTVIHELEIQGGRVMSLAFDSVSNFLAGGSVDGCINIWDTATGKQRRILKMDRPYEGMNITNASGISTIQGEMLKAMGAIDTRTSRTHR